MGKKWTGKEVEKLKQLFDEGISDEEIGIELGRSTTSIGVKRFKLGITDLHKRRFTKEGKRKMIESRKNRTGERNSSWKGGRRLSTNGYIELHMPEHHRARGNGYVFEHIVVLEQKIGRRLKENEQVHHINKDKQDNRPENLMVIDIAEHTRHHAPERRKGVTIKCVVCGKEFYRKASHSGRAKCCSQKCVGHYTNLKRKGELII